jgi:hypothetical protein
MLYMCMCAHCMYPFTALVPTIARYYILLTKVSELCLINRRPLHYACMLHKIHLLYALPVASIYCATADSLTKLCCCVTHVCVCNSHVQRTTSVKTWRAAQTAPLLSTHALIWYHYILIVNTSNCVISSLLMLLLSSVPQTLAAVAHCL